MIPLIALVVASTWTCEQEQTRVVRHLEDALIQLQTVSPPGLSDAQRAGRREVLQLLRRYIDEGQFPRSSGPTGPVFVDDAGRHCAMGALISWTGGAAMVEHIRTTRNLATVPTLADEPGLVEWLTEHGLAPEEAALVQPGYFECVPALEVCRYGLRDGRMTEIANGADLPDGGFVPFRIAKSNPLTQRCEGEVYGPASGWTTDYLGTTDLPAMTRIIPELSLVRTSRGLTPKSWVHCPGALVLDESALNAPFEECVRALLTRDPRTLVPMCRRWGVGLGEYSRLCGASGRFQADLLAFRSQARSLVEDWVASAQLDAGELGGALDGLDGLVADAWAHSTDGGTPLLGPLPELILWDGGLDTTCIGLVDAGIPLMQVDGQTERGRGAAGCQAAPAGVAWAALLVLLTARSRR